MAQYSHEFDYTAAIVCEHISKQRCLILSAFRRAPSFPEDSGWQFFCGKVEEENPDNAKMWALKEVLEYEPSLCDYMSIPLDSLVWRPDPDSDWRVQSL